MLGKKQALNKEVRESAAERTCLEKDDESREAGEKKNQI